MDLPDLLGQLGVPAPPFARLFLGTAPAVVGGGGDVQFPEYGLDPQVRVLVDEDKEHAAVAVKAFAMQYKAKFPTTQPPTCRATTRATADAPDTTPVQPSGKCGASRVPHPGPSGAAQPGEGPFRFEPLPQLTPQSRPELRISAIHSASKSRTPDKPTLGPSPRTRRPGLKRREDRGEVSLAVKVPARHAVRTPQFLVRAATTVQRDTPREGTFRPA